MAKYTILLATLLGVYVAGPLMSMEDAQDKSLNFTVDQHLVITQALAYKMSFFVPQKQFVGQDILKVIPLNDQDKAHVASGFEQAYNQRTIKTVSYALEGKEFFARIIPQFADAHGPDANFFVEVTAKDNS